MWDVLSAAGVQDRVQYGNDDNEELSLSSEDDESKHDQSFTTPGGLGESLREKHSRAKEMVRKALAGIRGGARKQSRCNGEAVD